MTGRGLVLMIALLAARCGDDEGPSQTGTATGTGTGTATGTTATGTGTTSEADTTSGPDSSSGGECERDIDCDEKIGEEGLDPTKRFCMSGKCVDCTEAYAEACQLGFCDPETKVCRDCKSSAECIGPNAGLVCEEGLCEGCEPGTRWCVGVTTGAHCNYETHLCEPCQEDFDCTSARQGGVCNNGTCEGCKSDADCSGICDVETGLCGNCTSNADCVGRDGPTCGVWDGPLNGNCYKCKTNDDCGFTHVCDTATGLCGSACASDADCANGSFPTCVKDVAPEPFCGCNYTKECPNPALPGCDPRSYLCEAKCESEEDCVRPETCHPALKLCTIP